MKSFVFTPVLAFFVFVTPVVADMKEFADYAFLSQYKSIEIAKVGDGTGEKVKFTVLDKVRESLRQSLKNLRLPVLMTGETPLSSDKVLLVEPRLIKYSGGFGSALGFAQELSEGKSVEGRGVTLFVRFVDKKLDAELGTVRVSRGGFSKDGNLDKAAVALAEIVKQKIYEEEGKSAVPVPVRMGGYSSGATAKLSINPGSNIAVLSLSSQSVSDAEASIASHLLRTEIVTLGSNFYNVLDREHIDKVMSEHAFAATGVTSPEGAVNLGKMLNAQKVITGSLSKIMDTYFLTVNMIDVETGKIDSAASGDYKTADDMKQAIRVVANQLVRLK